MKIQNKENNVSFQKLYAPKNVQAMSDFKVLKEFFVSEAVNKDVWVWTGKEKDSAQKMVEKFFIKVRDLTGSFEGKTKTEKLDSEQLLKALNRAVEIMETKQMKKQYNLDDKEYATIETTVNTFLEILKGKKKG